MRIERAIDAFLDWRRLERDATPSSVESYRRILWKLAEDYPEVEIDFLTTDDLRRFLNRWLERSAATRLERDLRRCTRSSRGPKARISSMPIRLARSDGHRSGSPTFTDRVLTNSLRFVPPPSATSDRRSCSWKAQACEVRMSVPAGGTT